MDNRGSKSVRSLKKRVTVKEQRVDGSGPVFYNTCLKCTLKGFEIKFKINNQSKLIKNKLYSTSAISLSSASCASNGLGYAKQPNFSNSEFVVKMNPWFLTGFSDGEASFLINIQKTNGGKTGWTCWLAFEINLSGKDLSILKSIKSYLGVGTINQKSNGTCVYYIRQLLEIGKLIDHFDKYPLLTQKKADYLLFKYAFEIIKKKEHAPQTLEGLRKLLAVKGSINKGFSDKLKQAFPDITPIKRPINLDSKISDPNWLAGFSTAEGSFMVRVMDRPNSRSQVLLLFKLTQHIRDEQLIKSLVQYLDCGNIYVNARSIDFIITKFSDIETKLIPLFEKYPIQGIKHLNYLDFLKVRQIMKNDLHLTGEGLKLIRKIKAGMNLGRI